MHLYSANRGIWIEWDVLMQYFTLHFQSGAVVEMLEKKQRNAAEFLGSILHSRHFIFNALS